MKAAVVGENGLEIGDVPEPEPKANEVLIKVRACGMNRADAMVASGMAHGRAGGPVVEIRRCAVLDLHIILPLKPLRRRTVFPSSGIR